MSSCGFWKWYKNVFEHHCWTVFAIVKTPIISLKPCVPKDGINDQEILCFLIPFYLSCLWELSTILELSCTFTYAPIISPKRHCARGIQHSYVPHLITTKNIHLHQSWIISMILRVKVQWTKMWLTNSSCNWQ